MEQVGLLGSCLLHPFSLNFGTVEFGPAWLAYCVHLVDDMFVLGLDDQLCTLDSFYTSQP